MLESKKTEILKVIQKLTPFVFALLTTIAICISRINDGIVKAFLVILLCLFYKYSLDKILQDRIRLQWFDYLVAFGFACGLEMMKYPNYIFTIIRNKIQMVKSGIAVLGYWIFVAVLINMLLLYLSRFAGKNECKALKYSSGTIRKCIFAAVFLLGIPYLYAFYPGGGIF